MIDNDFGIEYEKIRIKRLRMHRTDDMWLVEYQREPRWFLGLDRWWWFDDGRYADYADATDRIDTLLSIGFVSKAQFQKVKEFEVE